MAYEEQGKSQQLTREKITYTQHIQDDTDVGIIKQNFKAAIITMIQEVRKNILEKNR